jgi:hypothetical protein
MNFTAPFISSGSIVEQDDSYDKEPCGKKNKIKITSEYCRNDATCGCEECKFLFCSKCMELHLSFENYKKHTKTGLSKTPKCTNHPNKPSVSFCFDDSCCLCSTCILKHESHDKIEINEATQKIQKELESFSPEKKIKFIEESIEKINVDMSKRNENYELDLKQLKEGYIMDMNSLDKSKLKLKEDMNVLKEFKKKSKSSNILHLLQLKNECITNSFNEGNILFHSKQFHEAVRKIF